MTQRAVSAASPSNAAYAVPGFTNNATLAATSTVEFDAAMLSEAAAPGTWVIGTGTPRVAFTSLGESYPGLLDQIHGSYTLIEVG
jgi:hypothetical protein